MKMSLQEALRKGLYSCTAKKPAREHSFISKFNEVPETIILHLFKVEELYFIGYNMTSSARNGTNASVLTYHRIIEAFKFGYAWRSRLGDPAFNMDKNISEVSER